MKKIALFITAFLLMPLVSFAVDNVNYDIKHFYIKANIQDNGDLKVKELIVLSGSFNGYERKIAFANNNLYGYDEIDFEHSPIYNFDGIENDKISGKYISNVSFSKIDDDDFEEFEEVYSANKGDKRKFIKTMSSEDNTYRMYYESNHNKVGFLIEYTLKNAVVMHNDVAELYWQIITGDPNYNDDMDDVIVKVYLPGSDDSDNFRFWAHGPLSGEIEKISTNNEGIVASVNELDKSEDFDVRMTFDKSLITNDVNLKHTNVDALHSKNGIIEVEEKRAEEANAERARLKRIYNFFKGASIIITISMVVTFIYVYFKFARKPKVNFEAQYYREFIEDYNVEVIDYLYKKNLTPNALSAAIMNLVYKKKVEVEEIPDPKGKDKKKNYKFKLLSRDDLNESDEELVKFLFEQVGSNDEFTTDGLKKYASSLSTGSKFNSSYTKWVKKIKNIGASQDFYRKKTIGYILSIILLVLAFFTTMLGTAAGVDYPLIFFLIIFGIVLLIYVSKIKAYNEKGSLHVKKWNAFKNFLKDFGTFDIKELPEIKLWERYLVYATIFGLAKKVQKDMNVKINELENVDTSTYRGDVFTHLYIHDAISSSFQKAVTDGRKQYAASRANAYSSSSSGGGFGGGFSGGGGFGGGGGGGHGF